MSLAVLILFFVLLLIIVRKVGPFHFPMWASMMLGAVAVLLFKQIPFSEAFDAISWDVLFFLFGMFVVGAAIDLSGILNRFVSSSVVKYPSANSFLFFFIFFAGLLSALLMNDTVAVILTPFAIRCARLNKIPSQILLFALAASVTTGCLLSPIGAPPNLIIATHALNGSFIPFFVYLAVPTLLSLLALYFYLRIRMKSDKYQNLNKTNINKTNINKTNNLNKTENEKSYPNETDSFSPCPVLKTEKDPALRRLTLLSLSLIVLLILSSVFFSLFWKPIPLVLISFAGAFLLLFFSKRRMELLQKTDWKTLLFFVSMFVLIKAVHMTGFFQYHIPESFDSSLPVLYSVSLILSQFISNVPYVSLALPFLETAEPVYYMTLLAGSTIAGNLTIFGAASNVIIIQNAEKSGETLTFFEFFKFGAPIVLIQSFIFLSWLLFIFILRAV